MLSCIKWIKNEVISIISNYLNKYKSIKTITHLINRNTPKIVDFPILMKHEPYSYMNEELKLKKKHLSAVIACELHSVEYFFSKTTLVFQNKVSRHEVFYITHQ